MKGCFSSVQGNYNQSHKVLGVLMAVVGIDNVNA